MNSQNGVPQWHFQLCLKLTPIVNSPPNPSKIMAGSRGARYSTVIWRHLVCRHAENSGSGQAWLVSRCTDHRRQAHGLGPGQPVRHDLGESGIAGAGNGCASASAGALPGYQGSGAQRGSVWNGLLVLNKDPGPCGFPLSRLYKRASRKLVSPTLSKAAKCSADALSVISLRTAAAEDSLCRASYRKEYLCLTQTTRRRETSNVQSVE